MNQRNGYTVISVESRKGGVGKTTAALNLAQLLREDNHVLLLDLDITGTSINAISDSSYWRDKTNLLRDENGSPLNLLGEFSKHFLKEDSVKPLLRVGSLDKELINVFASELYGNDNDLIFDPSLVLEDMHVYWLIQMIEKICSEFEKFFNDKKGTVIILDNSPGFVGLGKAVHQFLTDLGPERGKFLSVSSLDIQDLESSLKAILKIQRDYEEKFEGAQGEFSTEKQKDFNIRLLYSGETDFQYYRQKDILKSPVQTYQGIILNKVPDSIASGAKDRYDASSRLGVNLTGLFNIMTDNDQTSIMVPFDDILMYQFYSSFVVSNPLKKVPAKLNARFSNLIGQIKYMESLDLLETVIATGEKLRVFDRGLRGLRKDLRDNGFANLANGFKESWLPLWPMNELLAALKNVDYVPRDRSYTVPRKEKLLQYYDRISYILSDFYQIRKHTPESDNLQVAITFLILFINYNYSLKDVWDDSEKWRGYQIWGGKEEWEKSIAKRLVHWSVSKANGYNADDNFACSLAHFIANDSTENEILDEMFESKEFTKAFTKATARIMDLSSDVQAFVDTIRFLTGEQKYRAFDPDYGWILDKKIIDKTISGSSDLHLYLNQDLAERDHMDGFKKVLSHILNKWTV